MAKHFPLPHVSLVTDSCHEIRIWKILLGVQMGIEPASPAFRASVLTTTQHHPSTKYIKFNSSNHPWQIVLQHIL